MVDYTILSSGNLLFEQHERYPCNHRKKSWGDPTITLVRGELNVIIDPAYGPYRERKKDSSEADIQMRILEMKMELVGISPGDIDLVFCTHDHPDHTNLAHKFTESGARVVLGHSSGGSLMEGVKVIRSPGHSDDHYVLKFNDGTYEVVVAGDAVVNLDYYKELAPYWMNRYAEEEIWETRKTMYDISRMADLIIPGHGQPFMNDEGLKRRVEGMWERYG